LLKQEPTAVVFKVAPKTAMVILWHYSSKVLTVTRLKTVRNKLKWSRIVKTNGNTTRVKNFWNHWYKIKNSSRKRYLRSQVNSTGCNRTSFGIAYVE